MLAKGVFRLYTAASAKTDDGTTYFGSIMHVSAKSVCQIHGNGFAGHALQRSNRHQEVGDRPKIFY